MVSEFLTPRGCLAVHISIDGLPRQQATEYLEYGQDNYWSGEKMVQHTLEVAIPIERAFPGKQVVFLFDNTSNYDAYAPDALLVGGMNLGPVVCKLSCGGIYTCKAAPAVYVFPENHPIPDLQGKAKGI